MVKWLKFVISVGKGAYELIDELRVEHRVNKELEAQAHRIQSQRYQDASKNAGHEVAPSTKRTLH